VALAALPPARCSLAAKAASQRDAESREQSKLVRTRARLRAKTLQAEGGNTHVPRKSQLKTFILGPYRLPKLFMPWM